MSLEPTAVSSTLQNVGMQMLLGGAILLAGGVALGERLEVATYAYVNPVVAVLLGWALAGESLGPRMMLASITVVTAVFLITTSRARTPPRDRR